MDATERDITFIVLGFITSFLNIAEVVLILRLKSKKPFDKFLLSLAISDILVGLALAAFKLINLIAYTKESSFEVKSFANILVISISFSTTNLVLITADRFLAVRFPIKHRILLTERRVHAVIALSWLLAFGFGSYISITQIKWGDATHSLEIASGFLLLFGVVMMMAYIKIFYLISKRTVARADGTSQGNTATLRSLAMAIREPHGTERAVFITGCVVTISFIICTYPFAFDAFLRQPGNMVSFGSRFILLLNSLFNPLIYFFKSYLGQKRSRTTAEVIAMN